MTDFLDRLTALDGEVYAMEEAIKKLRARIVELERDSGLYATEKDLKAPQGDPLVRFDPKGYRGPPLKGKRMSQCTPEGLRALAGALTAMADKPAPGKEGYIVNNRRDAAKARTWARKLRAAASAQAESGGGEPPPGAAPAPGLGGFALPTFAAPAWQPPSFAVPDPVPDAVSRPPETTLDPAPTSDFATDPIPDFDDEFDAPFDVPSTDEDLF